MKKITPEQVDALLPQTQCGLCSYGGCMPYAEAMIFEKANINLCPPGGVETLVSLGTLFEQDPTPYLDEMTKNAKPSTLAVIREAECIGCTKCLQACPVDAIIGGAKQMHVVITDACTGCELCIPPCPVDCIDLLAQPIVSAEETLHKKNDSRDRFNARQKRLTQEKLEKETARETISLHKKKNYIAEAIARAKEKKLIHK